MKKILLSAVAFMAAMTMNAQEVCSFNVDNALGLDSDAGTTLTAGTVIGETTSIVAKIGADNTYKPQSVQATVGGQDINGGLQGSDNPKDADSGTPSGTLKAPVSGAYLEFEAKANGWLYVIHKASSNKAYTVFEEGEAIGYTFAAIGDAACDLGAVYQFTLQGAGEYNYLTEAGLTGVEWAEREYLKAAKPDVYASRLSVDAEGKETWSGDDLKKGGIGVIKFAVYEGCKYIVNANGSKITAGGFFFDTTGDAAVVAGDVTILEGEGGNGGETITFDPTNLIPNFTYCWNPAESVEVNADGTLTFNTAAWGGVAAWLGDDGVDFSAYKYLVFEFAEATTVATQPFIEYANGTANTTNWTAAGVTKAYAEIDAAGAGTVKQIACQASDPTTLVITKIYLTNDDPSASNTEPNPGEEGETVLWEGEALVNGWGNQPGFLSDGGAELTAAGAAVGDILRIYCSAPDDNWQVEFTEGHWGGMYFRYAPKDQGPNSDGSAREYEIVDISKGYFDFVITEEFLTKATTQQWWGNVFLLNGDGNLTVTKVTLVKGGAVEPSEPTTPEPNGVDIIELSGETLNMEASEKPNFIFNGTDITIEMDRDVKVVENHGWAKGINIKNNGVGTIKLPAGVQLYGIEIYGFSQGDNWEYLLGWGNGDETVNDGNFEWVDPIGAGVKDNDEIKTKAAYPMDPCFFKSEDETVAYTNTRVFAMNFGEEPYEGAFNFTFSGNNQCDAMFILYLSKEAAATIKETTAISNAKVVKAENTARYNLAGQKVDGSYKGIVIQNGKKFIVK